MSSVQPHAWCHQIMLKKQGHGQITVIFAAKINLLSIGYMKNNICSINKINSYKSKKC